MTVNFSILSIYEVNFSLKDLMICQVSGKRLRRKTSGLGTEKSRKSDRRHLVLQLSLS